MTVWDRFGTESPVAFNFFPWHTSSFLLLSPWELWVKGILTSSSTFCLSASIKLAFDPIPRIDTWILWLLYINTGPTGYLIPEDKISWSHTAIGIGHSLKIWIIPWHHSSRGRHFPKWKWAWTSSIYFCRASHCMVANAPPLCYFWVCSSCLPH